MAWAFAVSNHQMDAARMVRDDWDDVLQIRPLESMAREAIGEDIHFLNTWFEHPDNDELWQMSDWQARSKGRAHPRADLLRLVRRRRHGHHPGAGAGPRLARRSA